MFTLSLNQLYSLNHSTKYIHSIYQSDMFTLSLNSIKYIHSMTQPGIFTQSDMFTLSLNQICSLYHSIKYIHFINQSDIFPESGIFTQSVIFTKSGIFTLLYHVYLYLLRNITQSSVFAFFRSLSNLFLTVHEIVLLLFPLA